MPEIDVLDGEYRITPPEGKNLQITHSDGGIFQIVTSTPIPAGLEKHGVEIISAPVFGGYSSGHVALNIIETTDGINGAWASAGYFKVVQGTTKNVVGYLSALELEVVNTCVTVSDWFCLVLNANSTTLGQHSAYIALRSYGSTALNQFLWIEDQTIGADNDVTSLVAANNPTAATHTLRIMIDDTAYYIMLCNAGALGS